MQCIKCGTIINENEVLCDNCKMVQLLEQKKIENTIINNNNSILNGEKINNSSKRKKYWLIPVSLFLGSIFLSIVEGVFSVYINDETSIITNLLLIISIICMLLVIPSIFLVIILYNKNNGDDRINFENKINSLSSEEKVLANYVGINYFKIKYNDFSVPAFFFSFIYMIYRKIYVASLLWMIIIIIGIFLPLKIIMGLSILLMIIFGFTFNKIYINYAKEKVNKIKINHPNISDDEMIKLCKANGGTSIGAAIIAVIVISVMQLLLTNIIGTL